MASVQSITAPPANSAELAQRLPKQVLGQEDFLKLLAVQFSSQDPLKPMEDTAFIAQMASFSALEIQNNMSSSLASLSSSQQLSAAQLLLGKQVDVIGPDSQPVSGTVSAVFMDGKKTMITVNNQDYDASSVSRIRINNPTGNPPSEN